MEQNSKTNLTKTNWETVILNEGEGEKILFRIGLMTFKVSSAQTNNNFMICETELPPEANVEPHSLNLIHILKLKLFISLTASLLF